MSKDWVKDIAEMHSKFGVHDWVEKNKDDPDLLKKFLQFRVRFLREELEETAKAVDFEDEKEIVDGLIDLCVVAIGTLDAFAIDSHEAWDEVHDKNMQKEPGVKPGRPNPLGLPDLIKPSGWEGPNHEGNTGNLSVVFQKSR